MILISFIADDHAEASVNFNKDTFAEDVEKTPHLVMFYAPWYVFNLSESDTFLFQKSQSWNEIKKKSQSSVKRKKYYK